MQYYWNKRDEVSRAKAAFLRRTGAHLALSQQGRRLAPRLGRPGGSPSPLLSAEAPSPAPLRKDPPQGMGGSAPRPGSTLPTTHSSAVPTESWGESGMGRRRLWCWSRTGCREEALGGRGLLRGTGGEGRPHVLAGKRPARASCVGSLLLNRLFALFPSRDTDRRGIAGRCRGRGTVLVHVEGGRARPPLAWQAPRQGEMLNSRGCSVLRINPLQMISQNPPSNRSIMLCSSHFV